MSKLIEKFILTGLGAVSLTKEKVDKIVKDLIKEGEISKGDGARLVREMLNKIESNKKSFEKQVQKSVKDIVKKINVPTRKEITDLKKQIEKLSKKLDKK